MRIAVRCDSSAPGATRRAIRDRAGELGKASRDALTLATELVAAVVRQEAGSGEELIDVRLDREGDRLRICVSHPGGSAPPLPTADSSDGVARLGAQIIDRLATRSASEQRDDEYAVWGELALDE